MDVFYERWFYLIAAKTYVQIFIKQIREYKYDHYNDEILIPNIQTRLENAQMSLSSEPSLIAYTKDGI